MRAVALLLDRGVAARPGPGRLPVRARVALARRRGGRGRRRGAGRGRAGLRGPPGRRLPRHTPDRRGSTDQRDRLTGVQQQRPRRPLERRAGLLARRRLKGTGRRHVPERVEPRPRPPIPGPGRPLALHRDAGRDGHRRARAAAVGALALLAGLVWRLRGPGRPADAAVLAAAFGTWALHAGVDWDWELTAVSRLDVRDRRDRARLARPARPRRPMPRLLRLVVALGCSCWRSRPPPCGAPRSGSRTPRTAFERGDCTRHASTRRWTRSARVGQRAEPWELIAYCDVRLGQPKLAIGAAEAAVRRDPDNWEYHYALALVRGAAREDPRAAAADALRLNPRAAGGPGGREGVQDRPAGAVGAPRPPPAAVPRDAVPRYPVGSTSRRCGVFLCPAPTHDSRSTPSDGPRRRPDRCDPRLRGLQAPELPDQ